MNMLTVFAVAVAVMNPAEQKADTSSFSVDPVPGIVRRLRFTGPDARPITRGDWLAAFEKDLPDGLMPSVSGADVSKKASALFPIPLLPERAAIAETRILANKPGAYAIVARRNNSRWFVGARHVGEARTLELDLRFLDRKSAFTAQIWKDGDPAAETSPDSVVFEKRTVRHGEKLHFRCVPNGGFVLLLCPAQENISDNGRLWPDNNGRHINAHGGGIWKEGPLWYWFGEHKTSGKDGNRANVGVSCYSSPDLVHWKDEGVALAVSDQPGSDIETGCVLERPKVIKCAKTGRFVMYFHLELKGQGYRAARCGIAVADRPTGPYTFVKSVRPNGHMSRDMTLYIDDDGKAYQIAASEENKTIHINELNETYTDFTGKFQRMAEGESTEAPAICKKDGWYYLIGSGCTGWRPNAARHYRARSITGPWERLGNPCEGVSDYNGSGPELTWGGQSTFILATAPGEFMALFDIWTPNDAQNGRYIWLPIEFKPDHTLSIRWGKNPAAGRVR